MYTKRLKESRKKMRFKFVFEPVHVIDCTDIEIRTEMVFSFVNMRMKK